MSKEGKKTSLNERIAQWETAVSKLADEYKAKPGPELLAQLNRKKDTLMHLKNMAKGDPRERARRAAETARKLTLDRAIKQVG
jgi:hypothetical protein